MESRFLTLEQFNEILRNWSGKRVKITKRERDDLDETLMQVSRITYAKREREIDDYESRYALQVNGEGVTETTVNNYEPLPGNLFEIPLEEDGLYEYDGKRLMMSTSRGVYIVEVEG